MKKSPYLHDAKSLIGTLKRSDNVVERYEQALARIEGQRLQMSSREIAELTGKRHDNVIRDVRAMISELEDGSLDAQEGAKGDLLTSEEISKGLKTQGLRVATYRDHLNRQQTEYLLDHDLTLTLISGYSAKLRYKVVCRLRELTERFEAEVAAAVKTVIQQQADKEGRAYEALLAQARAEVSKPKTMIQHARDLQKGLEEVRMAAAGRMTGAQVERMDADLAAALRSLKVVDKDGRMTRAALARRLEVIRAYVGVCASHGHLTT